MNRYRTETDQGTAGGTSDRRRPTAHGETSDHAGSSDHGEASGQGGTAEHGEASGQGGTAEHGEASGHGETSGHGGRAEHGGSSGHGETSGHGGRADHGGSSDHAEPAEMGDGPIRDGPVARDDGPNGTGGGLLSTGKALTATGEELTAISGSRAVGRIARREYRIAVRGRWALGLAVLFGVFSIAVVGFGTSAVGPDGYVAVVASLVELGVYLVPLAAMVVGYDTVVGAKAQGTLDMLFTLPVSQAQVVVGKYLGRLAVLGGAMAIGLGLGGLAATAIGGVGGLGQYALFVLSSIVTGGVFLGLSVLLSTLAREKTRALGAALIAWLWFVLLHDLVAIGLVAGTELPDLALTAMVLTNPADVYRLLVLGQLETTTGGFAAVLAEASVSVPLLVVALVVWLVLPLAIASVGIRARGRR